MSQAKEAQIKLYKTREDKEIDKVIALENKVKVLNDIVYKTGQSVQIMNMLNRNCKTSFAKPEFLKKAQRANPCLYDIGKPAIFSDSLAKKDFSKSKPVTTQNVSNDFSKPVTAQILPKNMLPIIKNTNVIAPGIVIPTTSVSRPQLKSNQLEDRVMSNNSQGKEQKVEDHRRNFKFSNNKTSVTACNDSLNAKTSNVKFVCVTCGKCVLNDNHDLCVLHYINGMNSRTRQPMHVPISTREPNQNLVEIILFIVDSGCSKHMTGNLKLLTNFVEKFLGTVKFGNDQIAPILGYGDLVQGTITIKRVYYVKGLNHNYTLVGQFCDADLEVAFQKSTCYIRDLKGNDLLIGSRGTDLYSITLQDLTTPNLIFLMAKATSSQACKLLNGTSPIMSKSSAVYAADNPDKRQQHNTTHTSITTDVADPPPLNIHSTHKTPTQVPTVTAPEHIIQAKTNTESAQSNDDEFINIFNHPLEQVIGNPSQSVRTRRQLETDGEMCMLALTVSRTEPKNIKEAMADSAWIESMQEELHQFDRLDVWELVDRPLCKNVINLKWLWKNKRDEENYNTLCFQVIDDVDKSTIYFCIVRVCFKS
ncbi:hypothetical protein Tco_1406989 [Tanacetum coccineum]